MLKHLYIKNFALIDTLDIELHDGFSVITGETGAGKSIILGAIGLLLGQRAERLRGESGTAISKVLKQGADKCVIEAHFDLSRYDMQPFFEENEIDYEPDDTILRRELTASGKSRAFINDTPVQLTILKELGERLIDVHSQHQNLLLQKHDFQLSVVDIIADDAEQLSQYQQAFKCLQDIRQQLSQMRADIERNRENTDFMRFQLSELEAASLAEGEQEELEEKSNTMSHAEDIKGGLYQADNALSGDGTGIISSLRQAVTSLRGIERMYPKATELTERLDSSYIELKDIAQEIGSRLEEIDFDPAELEQVNQRLDHLYDLEKKYHVETVGELISKRDQLRNQLNAIENGDETLAELEGRCQQAEKDAQQQADRLTQLRTKAAREIEAQMQQRLQPLGMPHVRFAVDISKEVLSTNGQDKVAFLFSANTSTPLQPISHVASGGEIARVMLSLKTMISGAVKLPTIIFDEIDTGVSGKMAEKMAEIMREMGQHERQVISITHLPQIAALGTSHYKVEKTETAEGTRTQMTELTADERIREIAQMLSGSDVSEAAISNAKELLKKNKG